MSTVYYSLAYDDELEALTVSEIVEGRGCDLKKAMYGDKARDLINQFNSVSDGNNKGQKEMMKDELTDKLKTRVNSEFTYMKQYGKIQFNNEEIIQIVERVIDEALFEMFS